MFFPVDRESLTEATSGAIGALVSTIVLYPLDTCKTKLLLLLLASSSSAAAGIYQSQRVVGHRVALSAPWRSRDFAAMDGPDVAPKGRPSTPAWIW